MLPKKIKVCIAGDGDMGAGIFYYLLGFDHHLTWVCRNEKRACDRMMKFRDFLPKLQALVPGKTTEDITHNTLITSDIRDSAQCDLLIEALPENAQLKQLFFSGLETWLNPQAILVSATCSIPISVLAPYSNHAEQFAGLHFYLPVAVKKIAEINPGVETSDAAVSFLNEFLQSIQLISIISDRHCPFVLNKIYLEVLNEAWLISKGSFNQLVYIDNLSRRHLFPKGILEIGSSCSLQKLITCYRNYLKEDPNPDHYAGLLYGFDQMVASGIPFLKDLVNRHSRQKRLLDGAFSTQDAEIVDYIRNIWLSASKRMTLRAHLPIAEANEAIRTYFDMGKGPFE